MLTGKLTYSYSQHSIVWSTLQLPLQVSPKWQLPFDVSYRTAGISASAYQYTFRAGARRFINEKWNIAAGLALFCTRTSFQKENHEFGKEYRIWQEVVREDAMKKITLQNRFRVEERFFEATSVKDAYHAFRFRYRLAAIKVIDNKWRLQLADEIMEQVTANHWNYQQNRLSASCAYLFNELTQVQAGYIWSRLQAYSDHYITISFQKIIRLYGNTDKRK